MQYRQSGTANQHSETMRMEHPNIREGVVFLPMHWGKVLGNDFSRANNLTSNLIDPISKEPDFKYSAIRVEKYIKPIQKIVVVGAGAAAYRFVQSIREKNKELFIFFNVYVYVSKTRV